MKIFPDDLERQAKLLQEELEGWKKEGKKLELLLKRLGQEQKDEVGYSLPEETAEILKEFEDCISCCISEMQYAVKRYRDCQERELDIIRAIR